MRRTFSIERALSDGLQLAFRRPATAFLWGLLLLMPIVISFIGLVMLVGAAGAMSEDPTGHLDVGAMIGVNLLSLSSNGLQLLAMVFVTAAAVVATAAAYRPTRRGPPYLGFGMEELMVGVTVLALCVGFMGLLIPLVLLGMGIGFAAHQAVGDWAPWFWGSYIAVAVVGVIILSLRLSLVIPASVLNKTLALPDAWRATRGQVGRLLGLTVVIWVIQLVLSVFVFLLIAVVVLLAGAVAGWRWEDFQDVRQLSDLSPSWALIIGLTVAALVFAWLQGVTQALGIAPYASAWLQLSQPKADVAADEPAPDAVASPEL